MGSGQDEAGPLCLVERRTPRRSSSSASPGRRGSPVHIMSPWELCESPLVFYASSPDSLFQGPGHRSSLRSSKVGSAGPGNGTPGNLLLQPHFLRNRLSLGPSPSTTTAVANQLLHVLGGHPRWPHRVQTAKTKEVAIWPEPGDCPVIHSSAPWQPWENSHSTTSTMSPRHTDSHRHSRAVRHTVGSW